MGIKDTPIHVQLIFCSKASCSPEFNQNATIYKTQWPQLKYTRMCMCVCVCVSIIVKHPMLPPCVVDGRSRNPLYYYYYYY